MKDRSHMALAGLGVVAIWHDLLPEAKDEFYEWHNREHMPERASIPGFHRGRRYIAITGGPEFFNLYEAEDLQVLGGRDYLQRLNSPTPWTRQVVASFRNVARSICRVVFSGGIGQGAIMLTQRFEIDEALAEQTSSLLTQTTLPAAVGLHGVVAAHLCRADESISNISTAERRARADATTVPTWIVMIEGVSAAAVAKGGATIAGALKTGGLTDQIQTSAYQLQHTRSRTVSGIAQAE